jgi:hypothetical protein
MISFTFILKGNNMARAVDSLVKKFVEGVKKAKLIGSPRIAVKGNILQY